MKGVPVWRRTTAPGKEAGIQVARDPASAMYMRSLKLPNITRGGVSRTALRTASLSDFTPALRETAKVQGRPSSPSRKFFTPLA